MNSTGRLPCCSRHSQPTSTLINTLDGSLSNSGVSLIQLFNPFVPSVPFYGTPNLTAFIKIIQALMGYTTDDAYVALNKLLAAMNLLRYLLRYEWLILDKS